ncbi:hypothetical protein HY792_01080 [Candidatus Desantisbacteria bacterium]|nr:hypothetical protein [Candidatus Desantisbacteria bacterium]
MFMIVGLVLFPTVISPPADIELPAFIKGAEFLCLSGKNIFLLKKPIIEMITVAMKMAIETIAW